MWWKMYHLLSLSLTCLIFTHFSSSRRDCRPAAGITTLVSFSLLNMIFIHREVCCPPSQFWHVRMHRVTQSFPNWHLEQWVGPCPRKAVSYNTISAHRKSLQLTSPHHLNICHHPVFSTLGSFVDDG